MILANLFKLFHHLGMKILIILVFLVSCAQKVVNPPRNLVLIQGVHLGADAWEGVKNLLDPKLFKIMDLGRIGRDTVGAASLKDIADQSCKLIPANSILVAHSYGGAIGNQMVGICSEKISKIIYVTAIVPLAEEGPFDLMNKTDQMNYGKIVTIGKFKIIPKEAQTYFKLSDPSITPSAELPGLHSEWVSLGSEMLNYDQAVFQAIPKVYLYTERDPVLSLTTQFQFTSRAGIKDSDGMQTGHYPMISNPERLSALITKWAKQN